MTHRVVHWLFVERSSCSVDNNWCIDVILHPVWTTLGVLLLVYLDSLMHLHIQRAIPVRPTNSPIVDVIDNVARVRVRIRPVAQQRADIGAVCSFFTS